MKGNRLYMLLIIVFLVLVFVYQYFSPKEFVWTPTFYKHDKQPFGSYVFDDVMSSSMIDYQVVDKTFYQLYTGTEEKTEIEEIIESWGNADDWEETDDWSIMEDWEEVALPYEERRAFLVTENRISFSAVDVIAILNLLKQGHKIMLCLHSFPYILCDSIGIGYPYMSYFFDTHTITKYVSEGNLRDTLYYGTDSLRPEMIYEVYPHLHPVVLPEDESYQATSQDEHDLLAKRYERMEILARNSDGKPVAICLKIGEGELFLVTTPLMFTNYGMLDGNNASYAFRLLSHLEDLPLTRIEAYGRFANQGSSSPLRYFLSQPPLRWAVYLSLVTILLCMIFSAKRRQWVIPVVRPPANETLRFTQLIGNLYYQRKDYKEILQKKHLYFCAKVKQLSGLDLNSDEPDETLCHQLATKMGKEFRDIWPQYRELKYLIRANAVVDETSMMRLIDKMNSWILNL